MKMSSSKPLFIVMPMNFLLVHLCGCLQIHWQGRLRWRASETGPEALHRLRQAVEAKARSTLDWVMARTALDRLRLGPISAPTNRSVVERVRLVELIAPTASRDRACGRNLGRPVSCASTKPPDANRRLFSGPCLLAGTYVALR